MLENSVLVILNMMTILLLSYVLRHEEDITWLEIFCCGFIVVLCIINVIRIILQWFI